MTWSAGCRAREDRRATNALLTEEGWAAVVAAAPGHVANVRRHVIEALTPAQVSQLDAIGTSLLRRLDPEGRMTTGDGSASVAPGPGRHADAG